MISDKFINWLKTAKGSELLRYTPKNEEEKKLIEIELDRRLDKNVPAILDNGFLF
jgi:hypothetical protein